MRRTVPLLIAAALVGFVVWRIVAHLSAGGSASAPGGERPAVAVEAAAVTVGPIRDVRLFTGSVLPHYQYLVATKVPGRVIELRKRIGDPVRAQEIVARLDDAEYEQTAAEAAANHEVARASLDEARAELELTAKQLERALSLRARDLTSDADVDNARSSHDAQQARVQLAEAQVVQRRAAMEAARIRLGYTRLLAAEPGLVGERFVDEGALLPANAAVVSIVGLDTVYVRTTVIERDYGSIRIGQEAQVEVDAFPDRRFTGVVARLAPVLKEESRVAEMEVVVANADRALKPGMFARVYVVIGSKPDARIVPAAAIIRRDGREGVFRVDETASTVTYVPVTRGITSQAEVEILDPVLTGQVVTLGQHLLEDGSRVLVVSPPGAGDKPAAPPAAEAGGGQ
jgi:RND family efflux transporter MFP subunit